MPSELNSPLAKLMEMLEGGLSEADRLGLEIVAARLSAIIEHLRELGLSS